MVFPRNKSDTAKIKNFVIKACFVFIACFAIMCVKSRA
jgi:hypothetical protein